MSRLATSWSPDSLSSTEMKAIIVMYVLTFVMLECETTYTWLQLDAIKFNLFSILKLKLYMIGK